MSTENARLDAAEVIVEIKNLEGRIVTKYDELGKTIETHQGQIKANGEATAEATKAIEAVSKSYNDLFDRLHEIEQKGVNRSEAAVISIGQQFIESDAYKSLSEGRQARARMEFKTAIINATGASQPLVQADRLGGINHLPNRTLTIRDVLPSSTTDSNLVEFTRENAFTNNAGPQIAGSPQAFENVTKPESGITFTLVSEPVVTLAHWIPASRQVLDDAAGLMAHINMRLMYGLKLKEETQILLGTGANHQLNGLTVVATAFTQTSPLTTNQLDIIRMAIKQAHVAEYQPDFLVLNPVEWFEIETKKVGTSDDRYVIGDPRNMMSPNLWGLPVVVTNSLTAGKFLIGSSRAAEIKDRQQAAVEMSRENDTNFVKNMVTVLAEERLALVCYRTEAFIYGSL